MTTNTNTLSLADLTGYEGLVFKKEWQIYVDGSGPEALKITHIFNDNGLLKLEWDPYVRPNFQSYRIWTINTPVNNSYDGYLVSEITDPHQNWWYDSSYVGGTSTYWVEIMASNLRTNLGILKDFSQNFHLQDHKLMTLSYNVLSYNFPVKPQWTGLRLGFQIDI